MHTYLQANCIFIVSKRPNVSETENWNKTLEKDGHSILNQCVYLLEKVDEKIELCMVGHRLSFNEQWLKFQTVIFGCAVVWTEMSVTIRTEAVASTAHKWMYHIAPYHTHTVQCCTVLYCIIENDKRTIMAKWTATIIIDSIVILNIYHLAKIPDVCSKSCSFVWFREMAHQIDAQNTLACMYSIHTNGLIFNDGFDPPYW